jgi:RimJ/RimL family protein N-acetyltransferase
MTNTEINVQIARVQVEDAAHVLEHIEAVAAETDFLTFGADELQCTPAEEAERLADMARRNAGFMMKACLADVPTIIGLTTVRWANRSRIRHVGEFALTVLRASWGKGVGRRLAESAMADARDSGITRLELRVREDNARAIALYQALGFQTEGRLTAAIRANDRLHDEFFMAAKLGNAVAEMPRARP